MNEIKTNVTKIQDGSITTPKGFSATGVAANIKKNGKLDLGAIYCDVPASCAGVYTLNKIQAAPLQVTKECIAKEEKLRAVIVNSGNANACTGTKGLEDAYKMQEAAANRFQVPTRQVAVASTGVIGELMPMEKVLRGIEQLSLQSGKEAQQLFSEAILTTDLVQKHACYQTTIDGRLISVGGVAKGSGMIHPNMATMLGFITTDANISSKHLQVALSEITDETFNRITVDGDTSTNDMVLVLASGLADNRALSPAHQDWEAFKLALKSTSESLAKQIARDGEGATKLVEVQVSGAVSNEEAGKVAKQIVGSDLVKTAMFGTDANWGRIICAVGYSGAEINPDTIDIALGPVQTLKNSQPLPFSEEEAKAYLEQENIVIQVNLHVGDGFGKAWGCDLSYDYVRINAGYRT